MDICRPAFVRGREDQIVLARDARVLSTYSPELEPAPHPQTAIVAAIIKVETCAGNFMYVNNRRPLIVLAFCMFHLKTAI